MSRCIWVPVMYQLRNEGKFFPFHVNASLIHNIRGDLWNNKIT